MSGSHGEVKPIPRIDAAQWTAMVQGGSLGRKPLLVSDAFGSTDAVKKWTPQNIAQRFAESRVSIAVGLPARGSPYDGPLQRHHQRMTVAEFARYMPSHPGSYMAQATMAKFPGLADELGLARTVVPPVLAQNLWVGNSTRSGLHFDMGDGLLAQVYGVKTATLIPAGHFAHVYPYHDSHTKSQVDPDDIDLRTFPRFAEVDRYTATLTPGDALFIPRLWWHHLVSDDVSVSVNAWFGRGYKRDLPRTILQAGPEVWRQTARDFVSLGILKRDFDKRLFVSKPSGLWLYEMLVGSVRN